MRGEPNFMKSETRSMNKINPVKCTFADIPIAVPPKKQIPEQCTPTLTVGMHSIEDTGLGNDICIDAFFGRVFLSDAGAVHEINEAFSDEYELMCRAVDEDPAGEFNDVLNYNDFYKRQHLSGDFIIGETYGWPTAKDWRTNRIEWDEAWIDSGPYAEIYGQAVFMFAPKEYCKPMECYMEVS